MASGTTLLPVVQYVSLAADPEIRPVDHTGLFRFRSSAPAPVGGMTLLPVALFIPLALDPEIRPTDHSGLFRFRGTPIPVVPGQPFFIWPRFVGTAEPEVDPVQPDHTKLHRYRVGYQTVGQPWQLLWPRFVGSAEPEVPPPPPVHVALHLYRHGYQTVGQPFFIWPRFVGSAEPEIPPPPPFDQTLFAYLGRIVQPTGNVPNVVGLYFYDAQLAILFSGLFIGPPVYAHSDTVVPGVVMSQSPVAGRPYIIGEPYQVLITVSKGPQSVYIEP